jgi:hypothetical protein
MNKTGTAYNLGGEELPCLDLLNCMIRRGDLPLKISPKAPEPRRLETL